MRTTVPSDFVWRIDVALFNDYSIVFSGLAAVSRGLRKSEIHKQENNCVSHENR